MRKTLKINRVFTVMVALWGAVSACGWGKTVPLEEMHGRVLHVYDGPYPYCCTERIVFDRLPDLLLLRYVLPGGDGDKNIYLLARDAGDGMAEVLMDANEKPDGVPPEFAEVEIQDQGDVALVRVHSRIQGQGNYWMRETFRYTGDSLERVEDLMRKGGQRVAFNEKERQYDTLHPVEWEGATVRFRKEGGDDERGAP